MNYAINYAKSYTPNALYPPYKRKVDDIYPRNSDQSLKRIEMEYLCDFAVNHSEKLSKIADYLYQHLKSGLAGLYKNKNYVKNTIEAVNAVMQSLNDAQLNIYTTNYLKIVMKLFEQSDLFYKELAGESLKRFCLKKGNLVGPHQYQALNTCVAKLCSLCNCNERGEKVRICAMQSLNALYTHLVPDESSLAPFFWENIDWVITSLMNIFGEKYSPKGSIGSELYVEAMYFFVQILTKANYSTIGKIIEPVFVYIDERNWDNEAFIGAILKIIMDNLKQLQANAIKQLVIHLENDRHADVRIKIRITRTVNAFMPQYIQDWFFIDIVPMLLRCLATSIERYYSCQVKTRPDEEILQNELVSLIANLVGIMPDYSKIEVVLLIVDDINGSLDESNDENSVPKEQRKLKALVRDKYMDVLYEICSKYEAKEVFRAFNGEKLMKSLFSLALKSRTGARMRLNAIIQFLVDKNGNFGRLKIFHESLTGSLIDVMVIGEKASREDAFFMRRNGRFVLAHLCEALFLEDNLRDNFEAIFFTLAFITAGVNDEEFFADFVLFAFHIQEMALINYQYMSFFSFCEIMSLLTAYFELLMRICSIDKLREYFALTIALRRNDKLYSKFLNSQFLVSRLRQCDIETSVGENVAFEKEIKNAAQKFVDMQKAKNTFEEIAAGLESFKWLFNKKIVVDLLNENNYGVVKEQKFTLSLAFLQRIGSKNSLLKYRCLSYLSCEKSKDCEELSEVNGGNDALSLDSVGIDTVPDYDENYFGDTFDNIKSILESNASLSAIDEQFKKKDLIDFNKKSFDQLLIDLEKSTATQANYEKYLKVMDFVANELSLKAIGNNLSDFVKREELNEIEIPCFLDRCILSGSISSESSSFLSFERPE